jgi:hypothetical protein
MRAIFLVLLIANAAFFVHQAFFGKQNTVVQARDVERSDEAQNNLQLLSEVGSNGGGVSKQSDSHAGVRSGDASVNANNDLCAMIGPYEQLLQAEYAVERLMALGAVARIMPVEIQEGESFWVYLKPEMSEKEAVRRLYELQKKNIESHIITKGELANGISFGRFADYAEAEIKLSEVKGQGYDVAIKRLPKTIQETWVVLDIGFAEKVDESVWLDLLSKQTGLEKRLNYCLGVASQ